MQQALLDNRYTRSEPLGSGGMAEVYLAHDEVLDRDVALKVLKCQYAENEEFVRRFRREARSAASLNHPSIVSIYDQGRSEDGSYYIAMEYVPGGTLKDRISREGFLEPGVAIEVALQIARALCVSHQNDVIHRDIKPQNILLTEAGYAKVNDFGIAKAATATTTSSRSGLVLGTAGYLSPEQAIGKPVDARSDLYSLGVVLYEMLTGTLPYHGEDQTSTYFEHIHEPPRSPRETNPNVPEPLAALTLKLLAKGPDDRYASAVELLKDLERVRSGLSPLARVPENATVEEATASILSTSERRTKRLAIRPPAASPVMEVFRSSRGRWRGRIFRTLAALISSVVLLGGLAWALAQEPSMPETSGSESAPGKEEPTTSALQGFDSMSETFASEDTSSVEETTPSAVQVPAVFFASKTEDVLTGVDLELGNGTSSAAIPTGVVTEHYPAAESGVDTGESTDSRQVSTDIQAPPTSVGTHSRQAPATPPVDATAKVQKKAHAAVQAVSTRTGADSQQAPTARTGPASSPSLNGKAIQKEQGAKKK